MGILGADQKRVQALDPCRTERRSALVEQLLEPAQRFSEPRDGIGEARAPHQGPKSGEAAQLHDRGLTGPHDVGQTVVGALVGGAPVADVVGSLGDLMDAEIHVGKGPVVRPGQDCNNSTHGGRLT